MLIMARKRAAAAPIVLNSSPPYTQMRASGFGKNRANPQDGPSPKELAVGVAMANPRDTETHGRL
jgi:hypothetical protein